MYCIYLQFHKSRCSCEINIRDIPAASCINMSERTLLIGITQEDQIALCSLISNVIEKLKTSLF